MKKKTEIIIADNLTAMGMLRWLEEKYQIKKSGKPFNLQDIEGYIRRQQIPLYLGGYKVTKLKNHNYNKLYNIIKIVKNEVQ